MSTEPPTKKARVTTFSVRLNKPVGLTLKADEGTGPIRVVAIKPGGEADKIQPPPFFVGDVLRSVDGVSVQGKHFRDVKDLIKHNGKACVDLGVERTERKVTKPKPPPPPPPLPPLVCPKHIKLSADIIARVASFADWKRPPKPKNMDWDDWHRITRNSKGSDVMCIYLAVGRIVSRTIKSVYLRNNHEYLSRTLRTYRESMVPRSQLNRGIYVLNTKWALEKRKKCADWAGENHRAWMSVNADWKSKTTDELMLRLQRIPEEMMNRKPVSRAHALIVLNPYMAFNNIAVAVELGLVEVIQYLIEEKNVDVNSFSWNCYFELKPSHLVFIAIETRQLTACQFLLSHESVDVYSTANADVHDPQKPNSVKTIFEKAVVAYIKTSERGYVDAFLSNARFDINARKQINRDLNNIPCLHLVYLLLDQTLFYTWGIVSPLSLAL